MTLLLSGGALRMRTKKFCKFSTNFSPLHTLLHWTVQPFCLNFCSSILVSRFLWRKFFRFSIGVRWSECKGKKLILKLFFTHFFGGTGKTFEIFITHKWAQTGLCNKHNQWRRVKLNLISIITIDWNFPSPSTWKLQSCIEFGACNCLWLLSRGVECEMYHRSSGKTRNSEAKSTAVQRFYRWLEDAKVREWKKVPPTLLFAQMLSK